MPPPLTASIITSFTCYTLANLLGLLSLAHVGRHHLGLRAEGAPRNYLQTLAHTCMLIVYALSFHTGYGCAATTDGNEGGESAGTCDRGLRIPDGFFIFGSFLLLFSLQGLLAAIQSCMRYDIRWHTLIKTSNILLFTTCFGGFLGTTTLFAIRRVHGDPTTDLDDIRSWLFTVSAMYTPLYIMVTSIMVLRLVTTIKRSLAAAVEEGTGDGAAVSPVKVLDTIRKQASCIAAVFIPVTIGVGAYTAGPYSVLGDGIATMWTAVFCAWTNYNIHIIRQVTLYSPSNAATDLTASTRKLRGLAAVEASNAQAASGNQPSRDSGRGSVKKKGSLRDRESVG